MCKSSEKKNSGKSDRKSVTIWHQENVLKSKLEEAGNWILTKKSYKQKTRRNTNNEKKKRKKR